MRTSQISAALLLGIGLAALSAGASGPATRPEEADLYEWLAGEEVPTTDAILAAPDAVALARSRIQDEHRYKVGVTVPLDVTIALGGARAIAGSAGRSVGHGAVRVRRDGFVWSAVVESPGATSMRLEFEDFHLAEGVELYLYNDLGRVEGPYTGSVPRGQRSFFTRALPTDRLHLQLRYDGPDVAAALDSVVLTLSGVAHLDERFLLGRAPTPGEDRAHCENLNAACVENAECDLQAPAVDPVVDALKDAVGEMLFQSGASWYLCTGGLIQSANGAPYLWTAHHCISTGAEAASLEIYFHFTVPCPPEGGPTTSCDYADGSNSDTPSMQGATIIDTSDQTDFTLLKLDGVPPAGTMALPYSTVPIANDDGTSLHRISHPAGAPQAYSEHRVDGDFNLCGPPGDFIYSFDIIGATEGGSEGSPVINEAGELVGQLYGACGTNLGDECDTTSNRTYDGAFAATWASSPLVRHALAQEPLPTVAELDSEDIPPLPDGAMWTTSFTNDGSYDNLTFTLTGPGGNGDLYVQFGVPPTLASWDCRPFLPGSDESCTFDPAQPGTYFVMVHAAMALTDANLTVTTDCLDTDGDGVCDGWDLCSGDDASGDIDGDGWCDDVDNCPVMPNAGQTDTDSDAVGDPCDSCPLTWNPGGGVARFWQTLVAPDGATFVWPVAEDVFWVLGDLAGVSGYAFSSTGSAPAATLIPSGPDPAPGAGSYVLVRADCPLATWSTGRPSECPPGSCAAGDRDDSLP